MSQFAVTLDASGNLTMAAGAVHCLHGTSTYFLIGGGSTARVPTKRGDFSVQREVGNAFSFHGGSGRNYVVSGGPSNPDLPKGYFLPNVPDEWLGPKGAQITRDPGTGALSMHDGTDELATGSGFGGLTGAPSAGTYPITDWVLDAYYEGFGAYYQAVGYPLWTLFHDFVTGDDVIRFGASDELTRSGGSTTDPAGTYVAGAQAEIDYNGGSPWNYIVTGGSLSGTLTATAYGETTYNGGSGFTLDIDAESDMPAWPNAAVDVAPYSGTAQAGSYAPTGWQGWQSVDDPDWILTLDGTGAGELSDGTDVVATRAADATKLYDPGGVWVATAYGETTYNGGDEWAGDVNRLLATPMEGFLYVELTLNGSNEVTAVDGPFFAASVPANSSTLAVFIIAESDGAGEITQVWEGSINWVP